MLIGRELIGAQGDVRHLFFPPTSTFPALRAQARAAHNRALAAELRARVAKAALGGDEKSRARHVCARQVAAARSGGAAA